MIDLMNKVIFVHIPKTAGTSIEKYFLDIRGLSQLDRSALAIFKNEKSSSLERGNQHNTLEMYENFYFGGEIPSDFRVFTVVRDPYARFWSEWKSRKLPPPMRSPVSFYLTVRQMIYLTRNSVSYLKDFNSHMRPQTDFLKGLSSDRLRVLRFENLNAEFQEMCADWNLPRRSLPRSNEAKRTVGPSDRDMQIGNDFVRKFYQGDFHALNYLP